MTWQIALLMVSVAAVSIGLGLFFWRRDIRGGTLREVEAQANKQALDDAILDQGKQREVREKYDALRAGYPTDHWDDFVGVRSKDPVRRDTTD